MQKHLIPTRLLELADQQTRFTESEYEHLRKCEECFEIYAQAILQVARARARARCRTLTVLTDTKK